MKFRKLRIAWSVGWGLFCLLLVALWVRSMWRFDMVSIANGRWVASVGGSVLVREVFNLPKDQQAFGPASNRRFLGDRIAWYTVRRGGLVPVGVGKEVPYWPWVAIAAGASAAAWLQRRFSLRTLLIAMTLAAVALGAAVVMMRR
jgi:hypothetical protein